MFCLPKIELHSTGFLSEETIEFHYNRHHRKYVENLNRLLLKSSRVNATFSELLLGSKGSLYNNAAQAWSHTFYWLTLAPHQVPSMPNSPFYSKAVEQFGTFHKLECAFLKAGSELFGAGWVWLVQDRLNGKIEVRATKNAQAPSAALYVPLMVCDVWEHAYYIDFRNSRDDYLKSFWRAINWSFVEENFERKDAPDIDAMMRPEPNNVGSDRAAEASLPAPESHLVT